MNVAEAARRLGEIPVFLFWDAPGGGPRKVVVSSDDYGAKAGLASAISPGGAAVAATLPERTIAEESAIKVFHFRDSLGRALREMCD